MAEVQDCLVIPIRLDALITPVSRTVSSPTADFTRLPYWTVSATRGYADVNAGTPFLSDAIAARPFEDEGVHLRPGIHLHWALPDPLTHARDEQTLRMPKAPNRWLVSRQCGEEVKLWIVESDYLHPEDQNAVVDAVAFPIFDAAAGPACGAGRAPWRRMGRAVSSDGWTEQSGRSEMADSYLPKGNRLTAIGWGSPTFAAYYPDCFSIFGFCDGEFSPADDVTYTVAGWLADPMDDMLAESSDVLRDAMTATRLKYGVGRPGGPDLSEQEIWRRALVEHFGWETDGHAIARRMICAGAITIPAKAASGLDPAIRPGVKPGAATTSFALGATASEALAAWIAGTNAADMQAAPGTNPREIEDRIEAVLLDAGLSGKVVDSGYKFRELRHERGFDAVQGGSLFSLALPDKGTAGPDGGDDDGPLPVDLGLALDALNACQTALDQAGDHLRSMQRRLYADWCRYQQACYHIPGDRRDMPAPDRLLNLLEEVQLPAVAAAKATVQVSEQAREAAKGRLVEMLKAAGHAETVLKTRTAPDYWRPSDPVLLIAGDLVTPTSRHDEDGVLACSIVSLETNPVPLTVFNAVTCRARLWDGQPWHPFLFEWRAEVQPLLETGNQAVEGAIFSAGYLAEHYRLVDDTIDGSDLISLGADASTLARVAAVYSGRSLLSPQAPAMLMRAIAAWLLKHCDGAALPGREALDAWASSEKHLDVSALAVRLRDGAALRDLQLEWLCLAGWQQANAIGRLACPGEADEKLKQDFEAFKRLLVHLAADSVPIQTQALAGFHQALLGQRQLFQLPLADPLGVPRATELAAKISAVLDGQARVTPMPGSDFLPLRNGAMRLNALRLVDTFGQVRDLIPNAADADPPLHVASSHDSFVTPEGWCWLQPRFCQPMRVDARWLAAGSDRMETNDHPVTSPVCGWVMLNAADRSLQVHAADGTILGFLKTVWRPADGGAPDRPVLQWQARPGAYGLVYPSTISDPALRRVVGWLLAQEPAQDANGQDQGFLTFFLAALLGALENIHPPDAQNSDGIALLVGRPLAIVRASLGLSQQGLPEHDASWIALERDLNRIEQAGELLLTALPALADTFEDLRLGLAFDAPLETVGAQLTDAMARLATIWRQLEQPQSLMPDNGFWKKAGQFADEATIAALFRRPVDTRYQQRTLLPELEALHERLIGRANHIFAGKDRASANAERVKVPVRLGEWRQLNDGLAGYWFEAEDGTLGTTYMAAQAESVHHAAVHSHDQGVVAIPIAPNDAPVCVTMIVDPHGPVHVTAGLLPTKALTLAPAHYRDALKAIQVFFQTAPVLSPAGTLTMPLRNEPGLGWTWLMQTPGGHWIQTTDVVQPKAEATFAPALQLLEGWLRLDGTASEPES